jgi:tyrosyl-tRNA synthetase
MSAPTLLRRAAQADAYVCSRCAFRATRLAGKTTRRSIGLKYLAKAENAEREWQAKAAQIKEGKHKSMVSILKERGLIHQVTGLVSLGTVHTSTTD